MDYLIASFCCTAVWVSGIGSVTEVLEVSVTGGGGDIQIPRGLLGCLQVRVQQLTKLFWSGDAYFGNQDRTYISSLHFSIPWFLVQTLEAWHSPEAFNCADCSGLTGLIAHWGDALSLSKFLALPDLSGSLLMGSRSSAAEPRFPE